MTDVVNAYFRRFYPVELDRQDPDQWRYTGIGWEVSGDASIHHGMRTTIFPYMLCADGFEMSVQGHHGGYCTPRDDFAEDGYVKVEILLPVDDVAFRVHGEPEPVGEELLYGYVHVSTVESVIAAHGGLFDWNAADLGPLWSPQWETDCLRWRGKVLTGKYGHWCGDYDGLPVDETSQEWPCACAAELEARQVDQAIAASLAGTLCEGCPPIDQPDAPARCAPCPRRSS